MLGFLTAQEPPRRRSQLRCFIAPDSSLKDASQASICSTVDTRVAPRILYLSEPSRQQSSTNPGVQPHIAAIAGGRSAFGVTDMTICGCDSIGLFMDTRGGGSQPPRFGVRTRAYPTSSARWTLQLTDNATQVSLRRLNALEYTLAFRNGWRLIK